MPLDRTAFIKPIAHRGLHGVKTGHLENTAQAFAAGLAKGYGIECDLQPAAGGTPMVFHDETLDRLMDAKGRIISHTPAQLAHMKYRGRSDLTVGAVETDSPA